VHHRYVGALYQLTGQPVLAFHQQCLVCGGDHKFDDCPVLANTTFLRDHYIRSCQYFRREAQALANTFSGTQRHLTPSTTPRPVHAVGITDDSSPYPSIEPVLDIYDAGSDTKGLLDFP
jgi:hypothetical protein